MGQGATGENSLTPGNGMRSWGSTPVNGSPAPEAEPATIPVAAAATTNGDAEKKKKKRKGDKGGTGSKANSKRPKDDVDAETQVEPAGADEASSNKKRKRDPSPAPVPATVPVPVTATAVPSPAAGPSDKTLKRIRKNMSKLDPSSLSLSLGDFIDKVGKGKKDESLDRADILQGLKVGQVNGKWVLEVSA